MNKREHERRERQGAAQDAKARSESEDRQVRIKQLWKDLQKKETQKRVKDLDQNDHLDALLAQLVNELGTPMIELVTLQKEEIDYLMEFRRNWDRIRAYYPDQLENLYSASVRAELDKLIRTGAIKLPKLTPGQNYEIRRGRWHRGRVGLIEREFGGSAEAAFLNSWPSVFGGPSYQPTCLDEIFHGGRVNMRGLEHLFGIERHRFPKKLPNFKNGRERLYDYRAVVKIMDHLLNERPVDRKKQPARGGSLRLLWLSEPGLRDRVLAGIKARTNSVSAPEHILALFQAVVRNRLPDSGKP